MIASLKSVGLVTNNLAGRFPEATGGVMEFRPEIYRPADTRLVRRPEIVVGAGSLDLDLHVSHPSRLRRGDFYEVAYKHAWEYNIRFFNSTEMLGASTSDAHLGNSEPGSYGGLLLSGTNDFAHVKTHELVWFAYDQYTYLPENDAPKRPFVPWGCAVVDIEAKQPNAFIQRGGAGATHQLVFEGKQFGRAIPLKTVSRTGGSVFANTGTAQIGRLGIHGAARVDGLSWHGTCVERIYDSLWRDVSGNELCVSLQGEATHTLGSFSYGLNLLGVVAGKPMVGFVDPGVFVRASGRRAGIEISGGISSSRPDIRGLPDPTYRGTLNRTYGGSAALRLSPWAWTSLQALGYVRYASNLPRMSDTASFLWWDPSNATPVFSRGADFQWDLRLKELATLRVVQNLNGSERIYPQGTRIYEWDLPWSTKAMVGLKLIRGFLDVFVIGQFSAGLPYRKVFPEYDRTVYYGPTRRAITYKRIDGKVQFGQPIERHRFLTRYDVYVDATNIFNWVNAREYYWDFELRQHPVLLQPRLISLGMRLGFRL